MKNTKNLKGALLFVGDELLKGFTRNTNLDFALQLLFKEGFSIKEVLTIPDEVRLIIESLRNFFNKYDFVICGGGLGPTEDDLTTLSAAKAFNLELVQNKELFEILSRSSCYSQAKYLAEKMSFLPQGAQILSKELSCAGFYLERDGKLLFFLPGVPHQFQDLLENRVIPILKERFKNSVSPEPYEILKFFDLEETEVNDFLKEVKSAEIKVGYYPEFPELKVILSGEKAEIEKVKEELLRRFEINFAGKEGLVSEVSGLLKRKKETIAVAESCTGGFLSSLLTSVSGSSEYFLLGEVTYSVLSKEKFLEIPEKILKEFGVVSFQTAIFMAKNVRTKIDASIGIGITGYAGPTGGDPENPVGTVYIGFSFKESPSFAIRFEFKGERRQIQTLASYYALDMIKRSLLYGTDPKFFGYRAARGIKKETS